MQFLKQLFCKHDEGKLLNAITGDITCNLCGKSLYNTYNPPHRKDYANQVRDIKKHIMKQAKLVKP